MKIEFPDVPKPPPWITASTQKSIRFLSRLSWKAKIALLLWGLLFTFIATIAIKGFFATPDLTLLDNGQQVSMFFDAHGRPLHGFCTPPFCREIIPLEKMGDFSKYVVIAEDKHFWDRWTPYDRRLLYAFWKFVTTLRKDHGGASTITQQLSKITSLTAEIIAEREKKTFGALLWRKGREMWIAAYLEVFLTRKEILEHYLNNVWCGERHGVQLCSRVLFGKEAKEVKSVADIALFTALLRKPSASPFRNPAEAKIVRSRVLVQFANEGAITEAERKRFDAAPLPAARIYFCESGHFNEFLRQQLTKNARLVNQGLRVKTTLDCDLQNVARKALRASMDAMIERNVELEDDLRGFAFLIDRTGAIKVFAQEPGFDVSQNLLTDIWRQAGSAYKPIAFGAMTLEMNLRWGCQDEGTGPCVLKDVRGLSIKMDRRKWKSIRNFDNLRLADYAGAVSPLQALAESRNAATMSAIAGVYGGISSRVSVEDVMRFARVTKLTFPVMNQVFAQEKGIRLVGRNTIPVPENTIHPGLTLPIGSVEVSPYEMARAFSSFAFGELVEPYAISAIKESHDTVKKTQKPQKEKIFEAMFHERIKLQYFARFSNWDFILDLSRKEKREIEKQAEHGARKFWYQMLRGLRAAAEFPTGTAHRAFRELGIAMCGKTGTATNAEGESTDNWFVGCTPSYIMVIWIGRDKKLPMPNTVDTGGVKIQETGGRNALPVFIATMKAAYANRPKEFFPEQTDPMKPFRMSETPEELSSK